MHLVFLTSLLPVAEPTSGFDIANRIIADALNASSANVSFVGYLAPGAQAAYPAQSLVLDKLEVTNSRVGMIQKLKWLAAAFVTGKTVSCAKLQLITENALRDKIGALGPVDGYVLNSVQMAGAFPAIHQGHRTIFIAHNVEALSAQQNAAAAGSFVEKILFKREAKILTELEAKLCRNADLVWVLANDDIAPLGLTKDKTARLLPLVTRETAPSPPTAVDIQYDIGMIGSWSWKANRIGLDWFLDEVLPLLPTDVTVAIAGSISDVPKITTHDVSFLGRVESAEGFLRSARVVPLASRAGTGVQLKTLELCEMGLPTVATRSAVRGIVNLPENCVVADDTPADFAGHLATMVENLRTGRTITADGVAFHQGRKAMLYREVQSGVDKIALSCS